MTNKHSSGSETVTIRYDSSCSCSKRALKKKCLSVDAQQICLNMYNGLLSSIQDSSKGSVIKKASQLTNVEYKTLYKIIRNGVKTRKKRSDFDALQMMKIEEDKLFLQRQREPSRPGYLAGVDKKLARREGRARIRAIEIENRRAKAIPSTSSMTDELFPDDSSSDCSEFAESDKNIPVMVKNQKWRLVDLS
nr:unnamed protein product [Callosobruchus chinensis]